MSRRWIFGTFSSFSFHVFSGEAEKIKSVLRGEKYYCIFQLFARWQAGGEARRERRMGV